MRFLSKKEWEHPPYLNEGIPQKRIYEFFDEVFSNIFQITNNKNMSREIFGISMTLFYYYTYLKSFKEFDRSDISISCVFLSCKVDFNFLKFEDAMILYEFLKKKKSPPPDLLKFEIEILNFLGFEINIETPYKYIYNYLDKNKPSLLKDAKFRSFVFNLVNDSYRRPMCIYWHPKYIALAVLLYAFEYSDIPITLEEILKYEKTANSEVLIHCLDNLMKILEQKMYML